jgi:hypothetical protein
VLAPRLTMKTFALAFALLPLTVLAMPTQAAIEITVHLDVTMLGAAPLHSCDVVVPAGSNGGALLDAAVAQGCILSWTADSFPGFGRYVTCMDHVVCGQVATYWALYYNGGYSDVGIDALALQQGDTLGLDYTQWVVVLP